MFGRDDSGGYGKLLAILGGTIAGGAALAAAFPLLKKRALRATTILKKDHRAVSGLFWAIQQTTNPTIRKSIFNELRTQLEMHTEVEEEIFYPAVRNIYTTIAEQQVDEAKHEHQKVRTLLRDASIIDVNSYSFMSKINELKAAVEHHVEEEESQMFPLAQDNMSSEELDHLGKQIHDRKVQLKERIAA
jgi:hemerythrin superfamily protein